MDDDLSHVYRRKSLDLKDFKTFRLHSKTFERQFSNIYIARLIALRQYLLDKVKLKWAQYDTVQLSELSERNQDEPCIIIGTLYKHQELKPSILRELSEELQITPQPTRTNYASFKDILFLEDEILRVKLVGNNIDTQNVVTGIVCALLGCPLENGTFLVTEWCFPGHSSKPITLGKPSCAEGKVLFISGLDLCNNVESLSLNLLTEWITGMSGCQVSQKEEASVVCIIIAGNSIKSSVEKHNHRHYFQTKAHDEAIFKEAAVLMHKFDNFLYCIAQCCPIILMPGEFDPSCHTIPQQPIHPCTLPRSYRLKSVHGVTNPWIGSINSCIIAGSSGQPIMDIMKVAGLADVSSLTWLNRTLDWGHFAPTAPDTLSTYPYFDTDPFIMKECPDIYFVGNMDKYDTKLIEENEGQKVRLICIPKFSETQTGVLVDLQDLRSWPISFTAS